MDFHVDTHSTRERVCRLGHCLWPHSGQKRAKTGILLLQLGQIFNTSLVRSNDPQKLQYVETEEICLLQFGHVKY
jgi:hypothetical protein